MYKMYTFHEECKKNDIEIVRLFLENGADVNLRRYGETPLFYASSNGHIEIVRLLLENGADVNLQNNSGETPLCCASSNGHTEIGRLLLENGADVNIRDTFGETPLFSASLNGHTDVISLLLENGADVNIVNHFGDTPLCCASSNSHIEVVSLLLENGAKVTTVTLNSRLYTYFCDHIIDSAQKFNDLYESFSLNAVDSFCKSKSTLSARWEVYKKHFKSENVDFPTLSNFKMFIKEDLQTNLLKNADFCKLLSLPSDIFQAESVALALQNSFSEKYNALTEVFAEMTESPSWNGTPAFTKLLSIADLMRFIVGFDPKTFLTLASFVVDQQTHAKSYYEEEHESDLLGDASI